MLLKDDKRRGGIASILSKLSTGSESYDDMKDKNENFNESEGSEGLEAAAQEVLSAIDGRDAKALVEALKAFYEMCD